MRLILVVLSCAVLLAGCATPSAPTNPSGDVSTASSGAAAPAGESSASGTTPGATVAASAAGSSPASATNNTTPVTLHLAFKGVAPSFVEACAFTPVFGMCQGQSLSQADRGTNAQRIEGIGHVTGGSFKVTSSSADPLQVELFSFNTKGFKVIASKAGSAPLDLSIPPFDINVGDTVKVAVFGQPTIQSAPVGEVAAQTNDVPFEAAGTVTLLALPAPPTHQVPYKFDGTVPTFAEACVFFVTCEDLPAGVSWTNIDDVKVLPVGANLTATWTSASPATDGMTLSFHLSTDHSSSTYSTSGASPLKLSLAGLSAPPGAKVTVSLWPLSSGAAIVEVSGNPSDLPFSVTGAWTVTD